MPAASASELSVFFFFNDTATTEIYTLSLHDALPICHTSASLLIQENADPDVLTDLERFFEAIAPEDGKRYIHRSEGLDDMPAHIRAALLQTQLAIPIASGRMVLGTWQGIYLFEHRRAPHQHEIVLHLFGE